MQNKPDWNTTFVSMAVALSMRSSDPQGTRHGAVITDQNHRILSCGYNGMISGLDDLLFETDRPTKLMTYLHAEENAMIFCNTDMNNSFCFITGFPCVRCARGLIQKGCVKIVYGARQSTMVDQSHINMVRKMAKLKHVELIETNWKKVCDNCADIYTETIDIGKKPSASSAK
jgi:deoxycytidylate deaminase